MRILLTILSLTAMTLVAAENMLNNGGFEGEWQDIDIVAKDGGRIQGQMPADWRDNSSWAAVAATYGCDRQMPNSGNACLKVTVTQVNSGNVQFAAQTLTLDEPGTYRASVYLRSERVGALRLQLRQVAAPYKAYGNMVVMPKPEWTKYDLTAELPAGVPLVLMVLTSAPTEFWVDDVHLAEVKLQNIPAPPGGNLIANGSFEAGIGNGWSVQNGEKLAWAFQDIRPEIVSDGSAPAGERYLRLRVPPGNVGQIRSQLIRWAPGYSYQASLWIKGSNGGKAVLRLRGNSRALPVAAERAIVLSEDWQRILMPFKLNKFIELGWLILEVPVQEQEVVVAMDDLRAELDPPQPPQFAADAEVAIALDSPGKTILDGEKHSFAIGCYGANAASDELLLTVTDFHGKLIHTQRLAPINQALPVPHFAGHGVFKARLELRRGDALLAHPAEQLWSQLPQPRELPAAASRFGVHIPLSPYFFALARRCGQRWIRLHDTSMIAKWAELEPEEGQFFFYDDAVSAAHDAGLAILGMLDGIPYWLSSGKRQTGYWSRWHIPDRPDTMEKWDQYCRTAISHYRGRIDHWEIWNEPWGRWWATSGGKPEMYVEFMRRAYQIKQDIHPDAVIVGVDTYRGNEKWTNDALAGGTGIFEVFSYHEYNNNLMGDPGTPIAVATSTAEWRKLMAEHGGERPIWNTEGGSVSIGSCYRPETGGLPYRLLPAHIVRYDVCCLAAGVERFFLYSLHPDRGEGNIFCANLEHDRAIKPLLAARAVLASLVDGNGLPSEVSIAEGLRCFRFPPENGRSLHVLWGDGSTPLPGTLTKDAEIMDIWSNPLPTTDTITPSFEPIYLRK
ncbi:MAG: hypothetical protein GX945_08945 [Lentisphaerae bacterium]|nr:hypothetical protein [Lentisphaerota bacterium]